MSARTSARTASATPRGAAPSGLPRRARKPDHMVPYRAAWRAAYPGVPFHRPEHATIIAGLEREHGHEETLRRWTTMLARYEAPAVASGVRVLWEWDRLATGTDGDLPGAAPAARPRRYPELLPDFLAPFAEAWTVAYPGAIFFGAKHAQHLAALLMRQEHGPDAPHPHGEVRRRWVNMLARTAQADASAAWLAEAWTDFALGVEATGATGATGAAGAPARARGHLRLVTRD